MNRLEQLHKLLEIAVDRGDEAGVKRINETIDELFEQDRTKAMARMGSMKLRMPAECVLRDLERN